MISFLVRPAGNLIVSHGHPCPEESGIVLLPPGRYNEINSPMDQSGLGEGFMFGMPHAKKAFWTLQLLTPDYLIEGLCDTDRYPIYTFSSANYHSCIPTDALQLISTTVRPTGNLIIPADSTPNWNVTFYNGFIAVIPCDEASAEYFNSNLSQYPDVDVDVYAGPYLIRGTLPIEKKEFKKLEFLFSFIIKDAIIDCLYPNSFLHDYHAPFVMVRTLQVQGVVLRG